MATPVRSPALFPAFVAQHTLLFDEADPRDVSAQFPGVALPTELASAVRKRQMEFAAGRSCAREVLRHFSPEHAETPIASGPSREPLWPEGIVGAITHTGRCASVAVARARNAWGVGLDAEPWMNPDLALQLADQIAHRDEHAAVVQATGFSFSQALTLIFSAKETVFKCLFPEVGRYFDFLDVAVGSVHSAPGQFTVNLLARLSPLLHAGYHFSGRFEHDNRIVWTGMVASVS
jgi:enterobactin synthetase component D